jgi:hypothetical protein
MNGFTREQLLGDKSAACAADLIRYNQRVDQFIEDAFKYWETEFEAWAQKCGQSFYFNLEKVDNYKFVGITKEVENRIINRINETYGYLDLDLWFDHYEGSYSYAVFLNTSLDKRWWVKIRDYFDLRKR